ncbi:class I SAM-dependent methyltransferase [Candidatus Omnitrophota bacterium]
MGNKWIQTFKFVYYKMCSAKLKKVKASDGIDALVDFTFSGCWELLKPGQVAEEIAKLVRLLDETKPKYVLEIGTGRSGGTLFLFSRVAACDATLVSVDFPGGKFGDSYPKRKVSFFKSFAQGQQKIHMIRADSHSPATLEKVKKIFGPNKLDFLFIDGDHTYEGVKRDFELYSGLVREGGIIGLHDIVRHPPETGCDVYRFWNEIEPKYESIDMVKDWNQKSCGIGVLKQKS